MVGGIGGTFGASCTMAMLREAKVHARMTAFLVVVISSETCHSAVLVGSFYAQVSEGSSFSFLVGGRHSRQGVVNKSLFFSSFIVNNN